MKKISIYTDGSCLGNPGPGGWAAILLLDGTPHRREISGGYRRTTNNRMEIMAAISALAALKRPCAVDLYTDSRYLRDAIEKKWLYSWQKNSWRKADKKPVLNSDLWQAILPLLTRHQVRLRWVAGHAGQPENERCDELARSEAQKENLPADAEFERGEK